MDSVTSVATAASALLRRSENHGTCPPPVVQTNDCALLRQRQEPPAGVPGSSAAFPRRVETDLLGCRTNHSSQ